MSIEKFKTETILDNTALETITIPSNILLLQDSGCGADILSLEIVCNALKHGKNAVILTYPKSPTKVREQLEGLGCKVRIHEENGSLNIIDGYSKGFEFINIDENASLTLDKPYDLNSVLHTIKMFLDSKGDEWTKSSIFVYNVLSSLSGIKDETLLIKFANGLRLLNDRHKMLGIYIIERHVHSERFLAQIKHIFDFCYEFRLSKENKRICRYIALTSSTNGNVSKGWIPYELTRFGLIISDFASEIHLRAIQVRNKRVKTGIRGLDLMLKGGFKGNTVTLLAGSPGTGKTTLGIQFIYNGVDKFNEPGIIITFEQTPDELIADASNFGWDLEKYVKEGKIEIIYTTPVALQRENERIENRFLELVKKIKAKRLLLDSISHYQLLANSNVDIRQEIFKFVQQIKSFGLTSIMTYEVNEIMGAPLRISGYGVEFIVDTVIYMRLVEIGSEIRKAMAILKMRGSDFDRRVREYVIDNKGIKIATPFTDVESVLSGTSYRSIVTRRASEFFSENK